MNNTHAAVIDSCDGQLSASIAEGNPRELIINADGRRLGAARIDHDAVDGKFNAKKTLLVVFGLPIKTDLRNPQAQLLSIYALRPRLHLVLKRTFGGGIFDVAFARDGRSLYISSRFGYEIIDTETRQIETFDVESEPVLSREQCGVQ
ncbi:hypothetical protein QCE49_16105 [Caballeronia sp. LZ008]|uniref:YncE family protein n=1 Tax=unclassified Caballeronia TaxID=2646786 RepID=UPI002028E5E4|nr:MULTISPECIES: hypothetical protein [unclassified Caballeronia]MDR5794898.1 hypothetical protein [Caballeronia sp. LZ008]